MYVRKLHVHFMLETAPLYCCVDYLGGSSSAAVLVVCYMEVFIHIYMHLFDSVHSIVCFVSFICSTVECYHVCTL